MSARHSNYLAIAFDQKRMINEATEALKDIEYDAIVGTGISGALAVPLLAHLLGKRFALIRKDRRNSHGHQDLEGNLSPLDRWIFVDDFVCSGDTVRRVDEAMNTSDSSTKVGTYLYAAYPRSGYLPV